MPSNVSAGREGLAAGIAMGIRSALGAAVLPLLGRLADAAGPEAALLATAALPAVAVALLVTPAARRAAGGVPS